MNRRLSVIYEQLDYLLYKDPKDLTAHETRNRLKHIRDIVAEAGRSSVTDLANADMQENFAKKVESIDLSVPEEFTRKYQETQSKWWRVGPMGPHFRRLMNEYGKTWKPEEDDRIHDKKAAISIPYEYKDSLVTYDDMKLESENRAKLVDMLFKYCFEDPPRPKPKLVNQE
jgi:hypothetical protein